MTQRLLTALGAANGGPRNWLKKLFWAGIDNGPKLGPVFDSLQVRGKPAVAIEPILQAFRIVGQEIPSSRIAHHLDAVRRRRVVIRHVESETGTRCHTNPVEWDDAEQQGAGGVADAIDDNAFPTIANCSVFGLVSFDRPAVILHYTVICGGSEIAKQR